METVYESAQTAEWAIRATADGSLRRARLYGKCAVDLIRFGPHDNEAEGYVRERARLAAHNARVYLAMLAKLEVPQ